MGQFGGFELSDLEFQVVFGGLRAVGFRRWGLFRFSGLEFRRLTLNPEPLTLFAVLVQRVWSVGDILSPIREGAAVLSAGEAKGPRDHEIPTS